MSELEELSDLYDALKNCIENLKVSSPDFNLNLVINEFNEILGHASIHFAGR